MNIKWINKMNAGYGIAFVLLILSFILLTSIKMDYATKDHSILQSDSTINHLNKLLVNIQGAQANLGNFALTQNPKNLEEYRIQQNKVDSLLETFSEDSVMTGTQRYQMERVQLLWRNLMVKNQLDSILHNNKNQKRLLASLKKKNTENTLLIDRIINLIKTVRQKEKTKTLHKKEKLDTVSKWLEVIGYCMLVIAIFLALQMLIIYNREKSAKKAARKKADKYYKQLENHIKELTKKNKEIIRLKNLEKYSSLGRIASNFAHDIKNPLTNINLSLVQLREGISRKEQEEYLNIIKNNSEKIEKQINNFLHITAVQELKIKTESINILLDEILQDAEDRIKLKNIKVKKFYSGDICDVSIDASKIKIAFLNIILNAIEAMKSNKKSILTIQTETKENKCLITISDNGSGMDKETVANIFEPYYTTKGKKGSGLGLAQAQNIILNHNGNIEVESTPGKGTQFYISLEFA